MKTMLKNENSQTSKRKSRRSTLNLVIVMTFILQLILPVGLHVNAMSEADEPVEAVTVQMQEAEDPAKAEKDQDAEEDKKVPEVEEVPEVKEPVEKEPVVKEPVVKEPEATEPEEKEDESSPSKTEDAVDDKEEEALNSEELEENLDEVIEDEGIPVGPEDPQFGDRLDPSMIMGITPLIHYEKGSLGAARLGKNALTNRVEYSELGPGEVRTNKKATRVPGMVNTWDIEVLIEGRDDEKIETTDVVLVIDRSGSMAGQQLIDAKRAARNFIDKMIALDPNLRIGIVSFSSKYGNANLVDVDSNFSQNPATLKAAINSLAAEGGTHTQAGILQGDILLNASTADNKYMVLLSDGEPTFSYQPKNWETRNESKPGMYDDRGRGNLNYQNRYAIYDGTYNDVQVGTGNRISSSTTQTANRYWPYVTDSTEYYPASRTGRGTRLNPYVYNPINLDYIDNGAAAVRAGEDVKPRMDGLYTIAVSAGTDGTAILGEIASPGKSYSTDDSARLDEIYAEIAGQISTQFAIRNAKITDEMGDGFSLIDGSIVTTQGTSVVADAGGINNQTITWTIDPAVLTLKPGSTNIRQATMTYRVEINPDIVNAPVATLGATAEHNLFKTNKVTKLNYLDSANTVQEKPIDSPEVDPVLLKIKKILKDEAGNVVNQDPRLFNVQITSGSVFDHTEDLVVGADYEILTTLRKEGTYNVEEISITGTGDTDLSHFYISYNIDGAAGTSFEVNHEGEIPRGDVVIEVTNEAIAQALDFTFTKVNRLGEPLLGAEFTLEREVGGEPIFTANSGVDPVFTFAGLTEGVYTLKETKAPTGYKLPTTNWTIKVERNEITGLLEIIIPDDSFLTSDPVGGNKVENQEQSEFPQTGGLGGLSYIAVGLTILTTSLGIYIKKEE